MLPEPARSDAIHMPTRYDAHAPASATASTPNDTSLAASPSPSTTRITEEMICAAIQAPTKVNTAVEASMGRGDADGRNPPEKPRSVRARSRAEPGTVVEPTRRPTDENPRRSMTINGRSDDCGRRDGQTAISVC